MVTNINMTKPTVTLATEGTYCENDIKVSAALQDKTVTPTTASQEVISDAGYAGLSSVTVNAAPLDEAQTVTAGTSAKTVSPTGSNIGIKSVTVNPTPSEERLATPKANAQVITPNSGKLLSSVTVDAVPTEEKTVTAGTSTTTVTPTSGKFFTSVTVNPTPTQIKNITLTTVESTDILPDAGKFLSKVMVSPRLQNKTFYPAEQTEGGTVWADEGYAGLESVEITGIELEEKTATENGVVVPYAGRFLSKVTVNVPSVIDVATAAEMDAKLIEANDGRVYRFTGTTDSKYTNGDLYEVVLTLISFSIGGTSYQAVEGMTWGDWLASKYNTADYYEDTSSGRVCINMDGMEWNVYDDDGTAQTTGMVIQSGYAYGQW